MPYLEESLQRKELELKNLIKTLEQHPSLKVTGQIKVKSCHPVSIHYRRKDDDEYKFLRKQERRVAVDIMNRDYILKLLKAARAQLHDVKKMKNRYKCNTLSKIYDKLNPVRKEFVEAFCLSDDEYAARWEAQPYPSHNTFPKKYQYVTNRNEIVASKSEQMIANLLFHLKIPYRYEYPVTLKNGVTRYPDFMILNKRTRQVYLLEHLGMMNDPDYATKNLYKLQDYIMNGYDWGINLLISWETDGRGLNMEMIKTYVKDFFT